MHKMPINYDKTIRNRCDNAACVCVCVCASVSYITPVVAKFLLDSIFLIFPIRGSFYANGNQNVDIIITRTQVNQFNGLSIYC